MLCAKGLDDHCQLPASAIAVYAMEQEIAKFADAAMSGQVSTSTTRSASCIDPHYPV